MKFKFRLERVLHYRQSEEETAKREFMAALAARVEQEQQIEKIDGRRRSLLQSGYPTLADMLAHQYRMIQLDDEEHMAKSALTVLQTEEHEARHRWERKRQEVEAIAKIRERALTEWHYLEERKEQALLDEWAVLRRVA